MRRFALSVVGVAGVALLAACTGGPTLPQPPADTIDVNANLDPNDPLETFSLSAGEEQVFRVDVSQAVADAGLLYVEVDRELDLEVMTQTYGDVTFSASSADYFGAGTQALGAAGAADGALAPESVTTPVTCRGSCVIMEVANAGSFYVRVTNPGGVTANPSLFVYGEAHGDEYEPGNDTLAGAPDFASFDGGAIETVGDVDYWHFTGVTTVRFDLTVGGIPLEAEVLDSQGNPVPGTGGPFGDGDEIQLFAGEYLRVWAQDSWQAGSSAKSGYFLEDTTPL